MLEGGGLDRIVKGAARPLNLMPHKQMTRQAAAPTPKRAAHSAGSITGIGDSFGQPKARRAVERLQYRLCESDLAP